MLGGACAQGAGRSPVALFFVRIFLRGHSPVALLAGWRGWVRGSGEAALVP